MRWLRSVLLPPVENDTDVDAARYRQREKFTGWDRVSHAILESEESIRERRHRNLGHVPERRHG